MSRKEKQELWVQGGALIQSGGQQSLLGGDQLGQQLRLLQLGNPPPPKSVSS